LSFLESRAESRQKSISVEFSFATIFAFKHHVSAALPPCSLILAYQGLEDENLHQKSPGPPGWGLMQQASPLLIAKKRELLKSPLV
jgi:hypothetical protein